MSELRIYRCTGCGWHRFPEPLCCGRCGGRSFEPVAAGRGAVRERTALRQGVALGSVQLEKGPVVIARLGAEGAGEVWLEELPDGAVEAQRGE